MNEATAIVITTADRSVKAISAATAGLLKVVSDVNALTNVAETLSADIQQKEGQLADLTRQLDLNARSAAAELSVRVAESETTVLNQLLSKRALAQISVSDLDSLKQNLAQTTANAAATTDAAVKSAEASLHAAYNSKLKTQDAEFKVANADLVARAAAANERIQFLTEVLAKARQDLVAERDARIKIAQAEAGRQGVVVNAGKQ